MRMTRDFYIPKDYTEKLELKGGTGVVYLYDLAGSAYAAGFGGKRSKPDFHYRFASAERRLEYSNEYLTNIAANEETRRKEKAERNAYEHTLKVGDILYSNWGYDQTNIDFYQVTKVVGKKSVKIRPIAQRRVETEGEHFTAEHVVAVKDAFLDDSYDRNSEKLKRVGRGNYISLSSYSCASPWNGEPKYQTAAGYGH